ncbi:epoxide hydrolase family protein [Zhongshania aquimaris]|uniref:Epoxide hydrolase 1 n=1 Tax=Zhongshania aquimaris TaxID=2857107 RepID=A0ABS6VSI9_9GAMM|nr:epoxide hydrolase [Zhongshania aquimaris]MBW2941293.1 epoxide hydrolase 1 [Zhongshania aquimaris]
MDIERFVIDIDQSRLDDLASRLKNARITPDFGNSNWEYGTNTNYLTELVEYWREDYDWRKHEEEMNRFEHFKTEIDGLTIHFLYKKGKGPSSTPLLLSHGWPWTFWDYQKLIDPLTDPAAYGGDAADAFDVVIPSLPGYGFSTPLTTTGINFESTADIFVKLMDGLGYKKFAAHGHDWGAIITAQLGHKYADKLIGAHFTTMIPLDAFSGGTVDGSFFSEEEMDIAEKNVNFFTDGGGYFALQTTRPQTLANALSDSPVGLCSWILEKRRDWSDCGGNVESRFSKDDLITTVMLYWLTDSFGTSARYYYEAAHRPWAPSHNREPVVEAPCGIAIFPEEILCQPEAWINHYYNLKQISRMESGGHFAAMEEPEVLLCDIQQFFASLR